LEALPELAARGAVRGGKQRAYQPVDEAAVAAEIKAVRAAGARYIFHDSHDYPPLLRMVEAAPPVLIARGRADWSRAVPVAMVGARNASAAAVRLAREMARELAEAGHPVVSGLARGIDGAAHEGALAGRIGSYGAGGTVAVIAGGIDVSYPPEHAALQERIAQEGMLITEVPPGIEPTNRHFPARNRIIAGIAAGTLVVEAAFKSGSLITARLAGDYGREVMAVPGSPLDPRSHGCNEMIREGAILVQRASDVIELLTSFDGVPRSHFQEEGEGLFFEDGGFDLAEARTLPGGQVADEADPAAAVDEVETRDAGAVILAMLGVAPVGVDEIVRQSGLPTGAVQMALVEMELSGQVLRHAGGRVSRAVS
jgi:DNA processing protein